MEKEVLVTTNRIPLKIRGIELQRMRELTLGCFWPSSYYPKPCPRFGYIADELEPDADEVNNADMLDDAGRKELAERIRLANKARREAQRIMALYPNNSYVKELLFG